GARPRASRERRDGPRRHWGRRLARHAREHLLRREAPSVTSRLRRLAFLTLALLGAEVGAAPEAPSPEVLERRMAEVRATLQRLLRNETSVGEELERWDRRVREAEATWAEA